MLFLLSLSLNRCGSMRPSASVINHACEGNHIRRTHPFVYVIDVLAGVQAHGMNEIHNTNLLFFFIFILLPFTLNVIKQSGMPYIFPNFVARPCSVCVYARQSSVTLIV